MDVPKSSSEAFHVDWSKVRPTPNDDVFSVILQLVPPGQRVYYEAELHRIDPRPGLANIMSKFGLTRNEAYAIWAVTIPPPRGSIDASPSTQLNYLLNTRASPQRQNALLLLFYFYFRQGLTKLPKRTPAKLYYGLSGGTIYSAMFKEGGTVYWPGLVVLRESASAFLQPGSGTGTLVIIRRPVAFDVSGVSRFAFEKQRVLLPNSSVKVIRALPSEEAKDVLNITESSMANGDDDDNDDDDGEGNGADDDEFSADVVVSDYLKMQPTDVDNYDPKAAKQQVAAVKKVEKQSERQSQPVASAAHSAKSSQATTLQSLVRVKLQQIADGSISVKAAEALVKDFLDERLYCAAFRILKGVLKRAMNEPNTKVTVWNAYLELMLPLCSGMFDDGVIPPQSIDRGELDGVLIHFFLDSFGVNVNLGMALTPQGEVPIDSEDTILESIVASKKKITERGGGGDMVGGKVSVLSRSDLFLETMLKPIMRYLRVVETLEDIKRATRLRLESLVDDAKRNKFDGKSEPVKGKRATIDLAASMTRALIENLVESINDLKKFHVGTKPTVAPCVIIPIGCASDNRFAFGAVVVTPSATDPNLCRWCQVLGGAFYHATAVNEEEGTTNSSILTIDDVRYESITYELLQQLLYFRLDSWPASPHGTPELKAQRTLYESVLSRLGGVVLSDEAIPRAFFTFAPVNSTTQCAVSFTSTIKYLCLLYCGGTATKDFDTIWSLCVARLYHYLGSALHVRYSGLDDAHLLKVGFREVLRGVGQHTASRAYQMLQDKQLISGHPEDKDFALNLAALSWDAAQMDVADAKKQLVMSTELARMMPVQFEHFQSDWFSFGNDFRRSKGAQKKDITSKKQRSDVIVIPKGLLCTDSARTMVSGAPWGQTAASLVGSTDALPASNNLIDAATALATFIGKDLVDDKVKPQRATTKLNLQEVVRKVMAVQQFLVRWFGFQTSAQLASGAAFAQSFTSSERVTLMSILMKIQEAFYDYVTRVIAFQGKASAIVPGTDSTAASAGTVWDDNSLYATRDVVCSFMYVIIFTLAKGVTGLSDFLQHARPVQRFNGAALFHSSCDLMHLSHLITATIALLRASSKKDDAVESDVEMFDAMAFIEDEGAAVKLAPTDPHVVFVSKMLKPEALDRNQRQGKTTPESLGRLALSPAKDFNGNLGVPFVLLRQATNFAVQVHRFCTHKYVPDSADINVALKCNDCRSRSACKPGISPADATNPYYVFFSRDCAAHADNIAITDFRSLNKTSWNLVKYCRVRSIRSEKPLLLDRLAMSIAQNDFTMESTEEMLLILDILSEVREVAESNEANKGAADMYDIAHAADRMEVMVTGMCQRANDSRITDRKVIALRNIVKCLTFMLTLTTLITAEQRRRIEETLRRARVSVGKFLLEDLSEGEIRPRLVMECAVIAILSLANQDLRALMEKELESDEGSSSSYDDDEDEGRSEADKSSFVTLALRSRVLIDLLLRQYNGEKFLPTWLFVQVVEVYTVVEPLILERIEGGKVFYAFDVAPHDAHGLWTGIQRILLARYNDHANSFAFLEEKYRRSCKRLFKSLIVGWRGRDPSLLLTPGERILAYATGVGSIPDDEEDEAAETTEQDGGEVVDSAEVPNDTPLTAWYFCAQVGLFYRGDISLNFVTGLVESFIPEPLQLHTNKNFLALCGEIENPPVLSHYDKGYVAKHPFQPATHTHRNGEIQLRTGTSVLVKRSWTLYLYIQTMQSPATPAEPLFYERFVVQDEAGGQSKTRGRPRWHRFLLKPPAQITWIGKFFPAKEKILYFHDPVSRQILVKNEDRLVKFVFDLDKRWMMSASQDHPWSPITLKDVVIPFANIPQRHHVVMHAIVSSMRSLASAFLLAPYREVVTSRVSRFLPVNLILLELGLSFTIEKSTGYLQCDHIGGSYLKASQLIPTLPHATDGILLLPRESKSEQVEGVVNDDIIVFAGFFNNSHQLPPHISYRTARESGDLVSTSTVARLYLAKQYRESAAKENSLELYQRSVSYLRLSEQNSPYGPAEYYLLETFFLLPQVTEAFTKAMKNALAMAPSVERLHAFREVWLLFMKDLKDRNRHFLCVWLWAFFLLRRSLTLSPLYRQDKVQANAKDLVHRLSRCLLPFMIHHYLSLVSFADAKCRLPAPFVEVLIVEARDAWRSDGVTVSLEAMFGSGDWFGAQPMLWLVSPIQFGPVVSEHSKSRVVEKNALTLHKMSCKWAFADIAGGPSMENMKQLGARIQSEVSKITKLNLRAMLESDSKSLTCVEKFLMQYHNMLQWFDRYESVVDKGKIHHRSLQWVLSGALASTQKERPETDEHLWECLLVLISCGLAASATLEAPKKKRITRVVTRERKPSITQEPSEVVQPEAPSQSRIILKAKYRSAKSYVSPIAAKDEYSKKHSTEPHEEDEEGGDDTTSSRVNLTSPEPPAGPSESEANPNEKVTIDGNEAAADPPVLKNEPSEVAQIDDTPKPKVHVIKTKRGGKASSRAPEPDETITTVEEVIEPMVGNPRTVLPSLPLDDIREALTFFKEATKAKQIEDIIVDLTQTPEERVALLHASFSSAYPKVPSSPMAKDWEDFQRNALSNNNTQISYDMRTLCQGIFPPKLDDKFAKAKIRSGCVTFKLGSDWSTLLTAQLPAMVDELCRDEKVQATWSELLLQMCKGNDATVTVCTEKKSGESASQSASRQTADIASRPAHLDVLKQNADLLRQLRLTFEANVDRWVVASSKDTAALEFPLDNHNSNPTLRVDPMETEYASNFAKQFLERLRKSFQEYSARPKVVYDITVQMEQLNDFLKQHIVKSAEACNFARESIASLLTFTPSIGAWAVRCEFVMQNRLRRSVQELWQALSFKEPTPGEESKEAIAKVEAELQAVRARSKTSLSEEEEEEVMNLISKLRKQIQAMKQDSVTQVTEASASTRKAVYKSLNSFLDDEALAVLDALVVGYLDLVTSSQQARRALLMVSQLKRIQAAADAVLAKGGQVKAREDDDERGLLEQDLAVGLTTRSHPQSDSWSLYRIFELENNICVRPYQFELCQKLVDVARNPNSAAIMYQLFMGDGKTTVILPLLVAILSSRADAIVTVTVPEALVASTANVLSQRFDSGLPKRILQLPFNRTLPPSIRQLADVLDVIKSELMSCMQRRDVLLQSPEHRLCFELRYYEVLLECLEIDNAPSRPLDDLRALCSETGAPLRVMENLRDLLLAKGYINADGDVQDVIPDTLIAFHNAIEGRKYPSNVVTLLFHRLSRRTMSHNQSVRRCRQLFEEIMRIPRIHVLDESDDILRYGSELHYSVGSKIPLHTERFEAAFMLVKLILADSETSAHMKAIIDKGEVSSLIFQKETNIESVAVPTVRWGSGDAPIFTKGGERISVVEYLAERFVQLELRDGDTINNKPTPQQGGKKEGRHAALVDFLCGRGEEVVLPLGVRRQLFYTARGWLACGVIDHVFSKRHRVEYGIDLKRKGGNGVAVPFRGSEIASDRAQFAHPDVLIGFTLLSYLYQGLNQMQTKALLQLALDSYRVQLREWLKASIAAFRAREVSERLDLAEHIRHAMDRFDGEELPDPHDTNDIQAAHALLRHNPEAVYCYLLNFLLPTETMQYPEKISGNGCHIAAPPHTVGFSGTDDTRSTMPHRVQCLPFEQTIHGKMLHIAARPKNSRTQAIKYTTALDYLTHVITFVLASRKTDHPCHILIDAGAICCGLTNRSVVDFLMSQPEMQELFEGCVYCDDDTGNLVVFVRAGRAVIPLSSSQISPSMLFCFLDDVHTRGIDVKFPPKATGIVTIGENMEKDKLMQAVMRLRQLDNGQRFVLHLNHSLARSIAALNKVSDVSYLTTSHVLRWVTWNTLNHLKRDFPSAIIQNIQHVVHETSLSFQRRSAVAIPQLVSRLKSEVQHDADVLYGSKRVARFAQHYLQERRQNLANPLWKDINARVDKSAFVFDGDTTFDSFVQAKLEYNGKLLDALDDRSKALLQASDSIMVSQGPEASEEQEQECQVEVEIEQVREEVKLDDIRRAEPLPSLVQLNLTALGSYKQLQALLKQGELVSANSALRSAKLDEISRLRFPTSLLLSRDFAETVVSNSPDLAFYFKCLDYAVIVRYDTHPRPIAIVVTSHEASTMRRTESLGEGDSDDLEVCVLIKLDALMKFYSFGAAVIYERNPSNTDVGGLLKAVRDPLTAMKLLTGECNAYDAAEVDTLLRQCTGCRASDMSAFIDDLCHEADEIAAKDGNQDSSLQHIKRRFESLSHNDTLRDLLSIAATCGFITSNGQISTAILDCVATDGSLQLPSFVSACRSRFTPKIVDDFLFILDWYLFVSPQMEDVPIEDDDDDNDEGTKRQQKVSSQLLVNQAERVHHLSIIANFASSIKTFVCFYRGRHEDFRGSALERAFLIKE